MPKVNKTPQHLRPYLFHGLEFDDYDEKHAIRDCPICDKRRGFKVLIENGKYRCWRAGCEINGNEERTGGNVTQFIRKLHELSLSATGTQAYKDLADDRCFLEFTTPLEWGCCKSIFTDSWLVPGYNGDRKLVQLYQQRDILYPTPTLGHGIFGGGLYNPECDEVFICEGPWDGMGMWELFSKLKVTGDEYAETANREVSLLSNINVLAVPGTGSVGTPFYNWLPLFAEKDVAICFDNDHPRTNDAGHLIPSSGWEATVRAMYIFDSSNPQPNSVQFLKWGPEGHDPDRPHNYDVRDLLCKV